MQKLSRLWCKLFHRGTMWPIHGQYLCPRCLLAHPVPWDEGDPMAKKKTQEARLYERRDAKRAEKSQMFRYPFGLLTILDFFANVRPAKKAAKVKDVAA